jgi:hypothetical protein
MEVQAAAQDQVKMAPAQDLVKMAPASPYDMGDSVKCVGEKRFGLDAITCVRFWAKYPDQGQKFDGVCKRLKGTIICGRLEKKCTKTWYGGRKCLQVGRSWVYRCSPEGPCRLVPIQGEIGVTEIQGKIGVTENAVQGKIGVTENAVQGKIGVAAQEAILGANKTAGYCAEGTICGAPVYDRPLWVWVLAVFVILLALKAIDDC